MKGNEVEMAYPPTTATPPPRDPSGAEIFGKRVKAGHGSLDRAYRPSARAVKAGCQGERRRS